MCLPLYSVSSCLPTKPAFRGTLTLGYGLLLTILLQGSSPDFILQVLPSSPILRVPRGKAGQWGVFRPRPRRAPVAHLPRPPLATPTPGSPRSPSSSPGLPWLHAEGARSAARTDSAASWRTCPASGPEAPAQPVCAGCPARCLSACRHSRGFPPHNLKRKKNH